jgi:hypothetical protein
MIQPLVKTLCNSVSVSFIASLMFNFFSFCFLLFDSVLCSIQCTIIISIQCLIIQCSIIQCSIIQCSIIQCSIIQCSIIQCIFLF